MKKVKGKMELRYYDIPKNEIILALYGEPWKRTYGEEEGHKHIHNLMEIGLCHYGNGIMTLEEGNVAYSGGEISIIPANYPHKTSSNGDENYWEYIFIDPEKILSLVYPDDLLQQQKMLEIINKKAIFGKNESLAKLNDTIRFIIDEMKDKPEGYREIVKGLAFTLMMLIVRANTDVIQRQESAKQKNDFSQIKPALTYIKANYAQQIKIGDIARECHISESHFRRLFEDNLGMTPVEYLNQVRIKMACDLIKRSSCSMEEVAAKVGFSTASTFNRNFKRIMGKSPYQWKKQPDNYHNALSNFNILVEKGW